MDRISDDVLSEAHQVLSELADFLGNVQFANGGKTDPALAVYEVKLRVLMTDIRDKQGIGSGSLYGDGGRSDGILTHAGVPVPMLV